MLDADMLQVITRGYAGYARSSVAFRNMWRASAYAYDEGFQSYVESVIDESALAPDYPGFAQSPRENSPGTNT